MWYCGMLYFHEIIFFTHSFLNYLSFILAGALIDVIPVKWSLTLFVRLDFLHPGLCFLCYFCVMQNMETFPRFKQQPALQLTMLCFVYHLLTDQISPDDDDSHSVARQLIPCLRETFREGGWSQISD